MFAWPVSMLWSFLSWMARWLVARGWLKSARLSARVISVGNIQVGGAGKTPLVARIANEAHERGLRICILCRGYGGEWEREGGILLPAQSGKFAAPSSGAAFTVRETGDEAALLRDLAPDAVIGVGADRVAQFECARRAYGEIDVVILDDGFQHWKIQKDVEIVAVTSVSRFRMLHRDWTSSLKRASLVVWTKGERRPDSRGRPCARLRYRLKSPEQDLPYWLVTGVADGRSVKNSAEQAGYRIARHISFPDHARYAEPWVKSLVEEALLAGVRIALTGKDWVKWREMGLGLSASKVTVLEPELEWLEGRDEWNRVLWDS